MSVSPRDALKALKPNFYLDEQGAIRIEPLSAQIKALFGLSNANLTPISESAWQQIDAYFTLKSDDSKAAFPLKFVKNSNDSSHESAYSAVQLNGEPWLILGVLGKGTYGAANVIINKSGRLAILKRLSESDTISKKSLLEGAAHEAEILELRGELLGTFHRNSATRGPEKTTEKAYVAMDLVDGHNLYTIFAHLGKFTTYNGEPVSVNAKARFVYKLLLETAIGLTKEHARNIALNDLKAENVIYKSNEQTCQHIDMGAANQLDDIAHVEFTEHTGGSPHYIPPECFSRLSQSLKQKILAELDREQLFSTLRVLSEVADKVKLDSRMPQSGKRDVWSLGVLFENLLTTVEGFESIPEAKDIFTLLLDTMDAMLVIEPSSRPSSEKVVRMLCGELSPTLRPINQTDSGVFMESDDERSLPAYRTEHHAVDLQSLSLEFVFAKDECTIKPISQRIKEAIGYDDRSSFLTAAEWSQLDTDMSQYPHARKYRKSESGIAYSAIKVHGEIYLILGKFIYGGTCNVMMLMNREGHCLVYKGLTKGKEKSLALLEDEVRKSPPGYVKDCFVRASKTTKKNQPREKFGLILELQDGYDLAAILEAIDAQKNTILADPSKVLALEKLVQKITLSMADAVAQAHANGKIHADVKLSNFVLENGQCVLIDRTNQCPVTPQEPKVWHGFGTPGYVAPELTPYMKPDDRISQAQHFTDYGLDYCITDIDSDPVKAKRPIMLTPALDLFSLGVSIKCIVNYAYPVLSETTRTCMLNIVHALVQKDPNDRVSAKEVCLFFADAFQLQVTDPIQQRTQDEACFTLAEIKLSLSPDVKFYPAVICEPMARLSVWINQKEAEIKERQAQERREKKWVSVFLKRTKQGMTSSAEKILNEAKTLFQSLTVIKNLNHILELVLKVKQTNTVQSKVRSGLFGVKEPTIAINDEALNEVLTAFETRIVQSFNSQRKVNPFVKKEPISIYRDENRQIFTL